MENEPETPSPAGPWWSANGLSVLALLLLTAGAVLLVVGTYEQAHHECRAHPDDFKLTLSFVLLIGGIGCASAALVRQRRWTGCLFGLIILVPAGVYCFEQMGFAAVNALGCL